MQAQWVAQAFGVRDPQLKERFVPSSEAVARAAAMGWGLSVLPELLARPLLASGALQPVLPEVHLDVTLYWHQWKLSGEDGEASRHGLMDQIGEALLAGARQALHPVPAPVGGDNPAP
jgi:LysR family transcriptional regulator (chromosome initiation inhibitor)